jgi:hypothetical protein
LFGCFKVRVASSTSSFLAFLLFPLRIPVPRFLRRNDGLKFFHFIVLHVEQGEQGAIAGGVERWVGAAVEFDPFTGFVGFGFAVQGGEHGAHVLVEVGTDFPNQGLGFPIELVGGDGPGQQQEIEAPVEVLGAIAVGNAVLGPATPLGELAEVFQPVPGQLPAGEDSQVPGFAAGQDLSAGCAVLWGIAA